MGKHNKNRCKNGNKYGNNNNQVRDYYFDEYKHMDSNELTEESIRAIGKVFDGIISAINVHKERKFRRIIEELE